MIKHGAVLSGELYIVVVNLCFHVHEIERGHPYFFVAEDGPQQACDTVHEKHQHEDCVQHFQRRFVNWVHVQVWDDLRDSTDAQNLQQFENSGHRKVRRLLDSKQVSSRFERISGQEINNEFSFEVSFGNQFGREDFVASEDVLVGGQKPDANVNEEQKVDEILNA